MAFGENLKELRIRNNLTQEELARRAGTSKQAISRYENSGREPSIRAAKALADALGVSVSEIAGEKNKLTAEDELMEYLDMLRTRPECRMFLDTVKGATKAEVEENVRFIEALRKSKNAD